jgi:hypothetical protein
LGINIGGLVFDGPYPNVASLEDRSGVYVILTWWPTTREYQVLDVGESATVYTRVANHDRKEWWQVYRQHGIFVAVHYTPGLQQAGRRQIEQDIRRRYNPPCGDR